MYSKKKYFVVMVILSLILVSCSQQESDLEFENFNFENEISSTKISVKSSNKDEEVFISSNREIIRDFLGFLNQFSYKNTKRQFDQEMYYSITLYDYEAQVLNVVIGKEVEKGDIIKINNENYFVEDVKLRLKHFIRRVVKEENYKNWNINTTPSIIINSIDKEDEEICYQVFQNYLRQFKFENVPDEIRIKDFEINEIKITKKDNDYLQFSVVYSLYPATDKWVLAGNGIEEDNGWIVDKYVLVDVNKVGNTYTIVNMGTGP